MRFVAFVNPRAGTVLELGREAAFETLRAGFAARGHEAEIHALEPRGFEAALNAELRRPGERVIVVGGGDGSIAHALTLLRGKDRPLGVLPLGTMNLLGRDLGLEGDLDALVDGLCRGAPRRIDLAEVNGRVFHSLSGLGFFGVMARERERARGVFSSRRLAVAVAAFKAVRRTGVMSLRMTEGDREGRDVDASAVLVTVNAFAGADWRRPRLDGGVFEVNLLHRATLAERLKAGFSAIRGRWREDPGIETFRTDYLHVAVPRRRISVATDGELTRPAPPLTYRVLPGEGLVWAPEAGAGA